MGQAEIGSRPPFSAAVKEEGRNRSAVDCLEQRTVVEGEVGSTSSGFESVVAAGVSVEEVPVVGVG